eukprot:m.275063 g.275063  ORF g.275063 m.275063 type:complete len:78 (+) comp40594_c1_seq8:3075-3308(+)
MATIEVSRKLALIDWWSSIKRNIETSQGEGESQQTVKEKEKVNECGPAKLKDLAVQNGNEAAADEEQTPTGAEKQWV